MLSRGRIGALWEEIARRVARPGLRVLDLGCGTGGAHAASVTASLALTVFAIFAALPWLPVTGHRRCLT